MKIKTVVALLQHSKNIVHDSILIFRQEQIETKLKALSVEELMELNSNLLIVQVDIEKTLTELKK
jgi:hypothetical protein